jgi:hypothetical protein
MLMRVKRFLAACRVSLWLLLVAFSAAAQQAPVPAPAPPATASNEEFLRMADEMLEEVSRHVALPQKQPLKKSLRSREEIRAFVERQLAEEKPEEIYADQRALERFGLLPKGFDLLPFLLDLLEEQVAGLYDPKGKEFYIADWLPPGEQRVVMAHELVHALQDQHFQLKPWIEAARPNDDAELARDAVAEGSATIAMFEFLTRDLGLPNTNARTMGDLEMLLRSQVTAGLSSSPRFAEAPPFLQDALMFPYIDGALFTQKVLKRMAGWEEFKSVFEKPPVSTQQILHPELYLSGVEPQKVELAAADKALPRRWKKLDENVMGEFGLHALLKPSGRAEVAREIAAGWAGDRYAIYENEKTKETLLLFRVQFSSEAAALRFFGVYSDALEAKYKEPRGFFRRPSFFSFASEDGGVFLHCVAADCLVVEGAGRDVLDSINRRLKRPAAPVQPQAAHPKVAVVPFTSVAGLGVPADGQQGQVVQARGAR